MVPFTLPREFLNAYILTFDNGSFAESRAFICWASRCDQQISIPSAHKDGVFTTPRARCAANPEAYDCGL